LDKPELVIQEVAIFNTSWHL